MLIIFKKFYKQNKEGLKQKQGKHFFFSWEQSKKYTAINKKSNTS